MATLGPIVVALFGVLGAVINAPGFDAFAVNYLQLFHDLTNAFIVASYSAGSSYILKNLLTDNNGNFLGIPTKS